MVGKTCLQTTRSKDTQRQTDGRTDVPANRQSQTHDVASAVGVAL